MNKEQNWHEVVDSLGPALFRYFRASFSPAAADDCVQETFVRLLGKIRGGEFDAARGSVRMYAYGIASFVRREGLRSERDRSFDAEVDTADPDSLEEKVERGSQVAALRQALARLGEPQRHILSLYLDEELKLEEIAVLTALPLGTIKSHIHRAKEELKRTLQSSQVGAQ